MPVIATIKRVTLLVVCSCACESCAVHDGTPRHSPQVASASEGIQESGAPAPRRQQDVGPIQKAAASSAQPAPSTELCDIVKMKVEPADWPMEWLTQRGSVIVTDVPAEAADECKKSICGMLSKYPSGTVVACVDHIYPLHKLVLADVRAGGYSADRAIFVVFQDTRSIPAASRLTEECLHHELSSMFWYSHRDCLNTKEWEAANPSGFKYRGWEGVTSKRALDVTHKLKEDGFVMEYSSSALENDFNVVAQKLMTGSRELWDDAKVFPRIQRKMELTIEFYHCVDSRFDEAYFKALVK